MQVPGQPLVPRFKVLNICPRSETSVQITKYKNCVQQWHTPPHQGSTVVPKVEGGGHGFGGLCSYFISCSHKLLMGFPTSSQCFQFVPLKMFLTGS
jgi:hypothetical protein